jgi:hypothetical protein
VVLVPNLTAELIGAGGQNCIQSFSQSPVPLQTLTPASACCLTHTQCYTVKCQQTQRSTERSDRSQAVRKQRTLLHPKGSAANCNAIYRFSTTINLENARTYVLNAAFFFSADPVLFIGNG